MKKFSYAKVKHYDFTQKPIKPLPFLRWLTNVVASIGLKKHGLKIEKINMEGLKPPYLVLGGHMSYFDMNVMLKANRPFLTNYVAALDGFHDFSHFLLHHIGVIAKRKFTKDLHLIKNMKYAADKFKSAVILYPEAKFSIDGTTSMLPVALGKLARLMGIPVVTVLMKGNYVSSPQWNKKSKPIPLTCFVKQILTQEEVKTLPPDQMQQIIEREMQYDDFLWQKENNIIIDHPKRAEGLNKILYKCCNCGVEHKMYSFGTTLKCSECGSSWTMQENGQLVAREGETRFSHIPDWFDWEDECVKKELDEGKYYLEDIVRVTTLPSSPKFYSHGFGKIIHSADGFRLECEIDGKPVVEEWESISTNGLHIEYDYKQGGDCIAVSTTNDSYWVYPQNKRDVLTKASFATDELYRRAIKKARTKA